VDITFVNRFSSTLLNRNFSMIRVCQLVIVFTITWFTLAGVLQAEGYLTSIGQGADQIPVVVVKGTPWESSRGS
jgi:isopenicillin-N N-acyltransferase like protein